MKPAATLKDHDHFLNALFFLTLLIFMVIAVYVHLYPENSLDKYIQELTHPLLSSALLTFWIRMTFFGSFEFLFPAWVIFILISLWKRRARFGLSVASLAIGSFLSMEILKQIFQRHRPSSPRIPPIIDYSFPSGHSTSSFIFCAVMMYSLWQSRFPHSLRITGMFFLMLLACSIGLSRIVLNVHYSTDVIAGFCFGMLWIIAWYRFVQSKI